jgi:hypothetical protein
MEDEGKSHSSIDSSFFKCPIELLSLISTEPQNLGILLAIWVILPRAPSAL